LVVFPSSSYGFWVLDISMWVSISEKLQTPKSNLRSTTVHNIDSRFDIGHDMDQRAWREPSD